MSVRIFVTVTKRENHAWAGKGELVSIDINTGIAIVRMLTGPEKGHMGGFDITNLRFRTKRINAPNAYKAVVTLLSDGFLLGGVRKHESSAFTSEADAQAWGETAVDINKNRSGYYDAEIHLDIMHVYSDCAIPPVSICSPTEICNHPQCQY